MKTHTHAFALALMLAASLAAVAQNVNPQRPTVVQGNSLVEFAPWAQSGIPGPLVIRGHDSYTAAQLAVLLPYDVPLDAGAVVLVQATNDIHSGVPVGEHMATIEGELAWLASERPHAAVYVANVPPFDENNCYGDFRQAIAEYNAAYAELPAAWDVAIVDLHTAITQQNGWAWPPEISGPCGIHFGQFDEMSLGQAFFMGQIKSKLAAGGEK